MLLRIRYENDYQTVELDEAATNQLWISFSLEGDDLPQEKKESMIQDAWEDAYNKPEYNIWHKETRHLDKGIRKKDKYGEEREDAEEEKLMEKAKNKEAFNRDENDRAYQESYEHACSEVRRILAKKPGWADMVIAVRLDGESIRDYAKRNGISENNVTQKLKRAAKKLRENWKK